MKYAEPLLSVLMLCMTVIFMMPTSLLAGQNDVEDYTVDQILALVGETYGRISSAKGTVSRVAEIDDDAPARFEGEFFMKASGEMLFRYSSDPEREIGFDGTKFRIYFPGDDVGYYTDTSELSFAERFVLGSGPYIGNILEMYRDSHDLSIANYFEGRYIIKASSQETLGAYVLIGVSPGSWTVSGIEQYDVQNRLIRQTRYLEFERLDDTVFFPKTIEISTLQKDKIIIETTYFRDITLNGTINNKIFTITGSKKTDWRERPFMTR